MQYLFSKRIDLLGIYLPFTLLWISFLFVPNSLIYTSFPIWAWVLFVVGFDVSHVWSTLFRTYFDKEAFGKHKQFLVIGPPVIFILTFCLAFISISWFWTVLAYIAVFHFIKQQYGFLALYRVKRGIQLTKFQRNLDKIVVYGATTLPILIWHFSPDSNFHWFTEGDFIAFNHSTLLHTSFKWSFSLLFFLFFFYWLYLNIKAKYFSTGAFLWISFTVLNWFGAIVFINSDYVFTTTNVVAHGLPYFILIIYYKSKTDNKRETNKKLFLKWTVIIVFVVLCLAFAEEFFWDKLINHEKQDVFGTRQLLNNPFEIERSLTAIFTALLALPQIWHYFVDGIIWKANAKNPHLKTVFKNE